MQILKLTLFVSVILAMAGMSEKPVSNAWALKKEKDGIKVFVRNRKGSSLKDIRVTCTLQSTLGGIVHILTSKDEYKEWIYACSESYLIKDDGVFESYHYQVTDAPWPVEDRDLVLHSVVKQNKTTRQVEIVVKNVTDILPDYSGKVRVPYYDACWKITPLGENLVEVDYTISLDPGGNVPLWVINLAVSEGPLKTMQNFRDRLEMYKDKRLSMIAETDQ